MYRARRAFARMRPPQQAALAAEFGYQSPDHPSLGRHFVTVEFKDAVLLFKKLQEGQRDLELRAAGFYPPQQNRPASRASTAQPAQRSSQQQPTPMSRPVSRAQSNNGRSPETEQPRTTTNQLTQSFKERAAAMAGTSRSFMTTAMQHLALRSSFVPTYLPDNILVKQHISDQRDPGMWSEQTFGPLNQPRLKTPKQRIKTARPVPISYEGWAPDAVKRQHDSRLSVIAKRGVCRTNCGSFYSPKRGVLDWEIRPQTR